MNSSVLSLLYGPIFTSIDDYWKNHILTIWTSVGKVMLLLFNMLSRFVIAFLPESKLAHSDFGGQENKIYHYFHLFPLLFAMK